LSHSAADAAVPAEGGQLLAPHRHLLQAVGAVQFPEIGMCLHQPPSLDREYIISSRIYIDLLFFCVLNTVDDDDVVDDDDNDDDDVVVVVVVVVVVDVVVFLLIFL
jgi:hypothetical protein